MVETQQSAVDTAQVAGQTGAAQQTHRRQQRSHAEVVRLYSLTTTTAEVKFKVRSPTKSLTLLEFDMKTEDGKKSHISEKILITDTFIHRYIYAVTHQCLS